VRPLRGRALGFLCKGEHLRQTKSGIKSLFSMTMVQAATLARTDEKPQPRRFRFGRWIVVILWGASAVVLAGLVLSYALPRNEQLLTLPGPTYVIVADGVATAGGGIEIEKDLIVVN
jgi:hypothetical protein